MCGLSSIQLDHTQCVQILWSEAAPTAPPSQGQGASSQAASSGLSYASVGQGPHEQAHILTTLPESDPLREDFQSQPDHLRNDLKDPR